MVQEYETLKNEYNLLEMAHNELQENSDKKSESIQFMKDQIADLKKEIVSITAECNRFKLHKELQGQDFSAGPQNFMKWIMTNNQSTNNFNDVVSSLFCPFCVYNYPYI